MLQNVFKKGQVQMGGGHNPQTTYKGEKQAVETNIEQSDRDGGAKGLKNTGKREIIKDTGGMHEGNQRTGGNVI